MSVIVKSKEEISKSPLNMSKSKQLFSFPKAERFPKMKENQYKILIKIYNFYN